MRSIREEFEEQEKQNRQQMFDKITVKINEIRHHVADGVSRYFIEQELEELEEALS